jgi:serine/threonine protein kinase/Flp pilus assembly protein TadD
MGQQRQSVEQLFGVAVEQEPGARQAFLDRTCRDAPTLRSFVEELLRENERAGSFPKKSLTARIGCSPSTAFTAFDTQRALATETPKCARFTPGETIAGRFLVVRFIARGGMGEVYEVEDTLLHGNRVALKTILPQIAADPDACHRFQQEVLLARTIHHPNLCPIYEIFRCEESPPAFLFLTMKLLHGETLESTLRESLVLPRNEALQLFHQMVCGIAAMHAAGIIHRDVKPANVMLDRSAAGLCVSIMDFGLARLNEFQSAVLRPNVLAGTPGYLAPELIKGHHPSQASDIFALGVLLHEVLTGERPNVSADGFSLSPAPSLNLAHVPSIYLRAVGDFLSENPVIRCRAFEQIRSAIEENAPSYLGLRDSPRTWSRRQMLIASGATFCAVVGGTAWKYERISEMIHPLPLKRFVALVGWPPSPDVRIKPMLLGLMDSIANELARAEVYDPNLLVIPHLSSTDVNTTGQLNEVRESLGANLILAASGVHSRKDLQVSLKVLDSPSFRPLRTKDIRVSLDRQLSLPQKAVRAAAELLNVNHSKSDEKRIAAGTENPAAYTAFNEAEASRKKDNDAGLELAIEKYKEATDLDRHYSQAHAKLALAYCRLWALKHDPAALVLSRANANAALALDPVLADAYNARGFALQQIGDGPNAMRDLTTALALDPGNTQTLIWQAQFYTDLNQWRGAEDCFHRALRLRPNFWLIHNELGVLLTRQGKYADALAEFRAASLVNPRNALALFNMGCIYLQLGRPEEAIERLRQSMKLKPDAAVSATMAQALRSQGKTIPALQLAREATELDPSDSTTWLELGDSYSTLRGHGAEARRAYAEGALVQRESLEQNPMDGPGWILLALLEAKAGSETKARLDLQKGDALPSADVDTQLYKARTFQQIGMREEALSTLAACFKAGATRFQLELMPEMTALKKDPLYQRLVGHAGG